MVMRTRFVISSGNSMSSNGEHRESSGRAAGHVPKTTASQSSGHRTVLLHEAIEQLGIKSGDIVVDATLGGAGHATAIAELLGKGGALIGMDLDQEAIERAKIALEKFSEPMGLASAPVDGPMGATISFCICASPTFCTCLTLLPFIHSVKSDADAIESAQPEPSNATSCILPFASTRSWSVRWSPQSGFATEAEWVGFFSVPKFSGCR